jgi:hypothetical protein
MDEINQPATASPITERPIIFLSHDRMQAA